MLSSDRIRGPTRFGKALNFFFSPSFLSLHKERLAQWPAFCDAENGPKIPGGGGEILSEKLGGVCSMLPETLTLHVFQTKICDFPCPISDLIKNLIPYFRPKALEPGT